MEIVFPCDHCGKNLVADEAGQGQTVECPECGKPVTIPVTSGKAHSSKRVIRVPAAKPKDVPPEKAPPDAKAEVAAPPVAAPAPAADTRLMEIVVGWICVIVGTVLAVLLPRAYLVYAPFFVGAFLMSFVLMANGRMLQAVVLLLCTCVPPPLLMRQNIWRNVQPSAPRAQSDSGRAQKLVFDSAGKPKLVSTDEPSQPIRTAVAAPAAPSRSTPRPRRLADQPKPPAPPPAEPSGPTSLTEYSPATPPPGSPPAHAGGEKSVDEMYKELIEGKAEVPPLVPEDVLEQTAIGHEADFRWQKEGLGEGMMPGDPAPVVDVPFVVYSDGGLKETYAATGRLGNKGAFRMDDSWDAKPHSGTTCIRVEYQDAGDWVTAAWQHPGNNWGDFPGGFDLSKARELTFWAKGESGHEKVEFMVGMEQAQTAVSHDTLKASTGIIELRKDWKKYSIPLEDKDRTRLITGFLFRIEGQGKPVVFFLDDIQFE
jgi:hypothetical protein